MAGAAEKKKKEEQQKRRDERKEKEAAKRKSRRSNTEGGTLQERLKTRESKLKKGFTNTMTSSEGGGDRSACPSTQTGYPVKRE